MAPDPNQAVLDSNQPSPPKLSPENGSGEPEPSKQIVPDRFFAARHLFGDMKLWDLVQIDIHGGLVALVALTFVMTRSPRRSIPRQSSDEMQRRHP
jgi:hypothetical protein